MKILVTGGAGFLGGYIMSALLEAGHDPIAYDLQKPSAELISMMPSLADRTEIGEIGDEDNLKRVCQTYQIEAIVHAAGRVGFENSLADPRAYYQTNIMGFVNVCEVARSLSMKKVVLISSNSVYHKGKGTSLSEADLPFSTTRATPAAHYGTSKMACEAIGLVYSEFHNIDFFALRVTAIYGFGMRVPIQIKPMVENAVLGKPSRFETGGPMKRDYTYVLDCAAAVVLTINAPPQPVGAERIFNISAGNAKTGAELAEVVRATVSGADIEMGMGLTALEEENLKMRAPLDCSLAREVLGWEPKWTIEAGISHYMERYRSFIENP